MPLFGFYFGVRESSESFILSSAPFGPDSSLLRLITKFYLIELFGDDVNL